jgi:hypothetical protein
MIARQHLSFATIFEVFKGFLLSGKIHMLDSDKHFVKSDILYMNISLPDYKVGTPKEGIIYKWVRKAGGYLFFQEPHNRLLQMDGFIVNTNWEYQIMAQEGQGLLPQNVVIFELKNSPMMIIESFIIYDDKFDLW